MRKSNRWKILPQRSDGVVPINSCVRPVDVQDLTKIFSGTFKVTLSKRGNRTTLLSEPLIWLFLKSKGKFGMVLTGGIW